tara:strand:+ start:1824 stop:2948 length:1125 start_codon:yes stop_codon:yes gene_type:complete
VHIVYFFTYGYSIESWDSAGILDREIKIFRSLIEKHNLRFTFVTYGGESDYNFDLGENIKVLPIYSIINKSKNRFWNLIKSFFLTKLLLNEIDHFDLIKQNQLLGSWAAILLKINSRKPLYTRTGYDMFLFSLKERKSFIKIISYYFLTQVTLLYSNLYSVTSNQDLIFLNKYFIFKKNKIIIRQNWVVSKKFQDFSKRDSKKIISVGRLEKQKDYRYLIESLSGTDFSLDIVGSGSKKSELLELANNLSIKVNFLGVIKNENLLELYNQYRYFVSTSKFEGNPKAILEAMSSGCVVIARNIPNNSEIITDSINGFVFDEDNESLNKILRNINKLNGLEEISSKAKEHVKKYNSLEDLSNKIYSDLLSLKLTDN